MNGIQQNALIEEPVFIQLAQFMRNVRAGRQVPDFADIDLMDAYAIASQIFILDVVRPDYRFRVRYAGGGIRDVFGWEATGRFLDEIDLGPYSEKILGAYRRVATTSEPLFTCGTMVARGPLAPSDEELQPIAMKRIAFPARGAGGNVDHIVGALVRSKVGTTAVPFILEPVPELRLWRLADEVAGAPCGNDPV